MPTESIFLAMLEHTNAVVAGLIAWVVYLLRRWATVATEALKLLREIRAEQESRQDRADHMDRAAQAGQRRRKDDPRS